MIYTTPHPGAESKKLPPGIAILPRKPSLAGFEKVPKYWMAGNPFLSHGDNVFSIFIPEGERFFVKSVNRFRDRIHDPELSEQVAAFVRQEAYHSRLHDDYNASLAAKGIDVDREIANVEKLFRRLERTVPAKMQLGMTAFLEHITAISARMLFEHPSWAAAMDPTMLELWEWHAVEEMEHKAVAFDVFAAVGGGYLLRVFSGVFALLVLGWFYARSHRRVMRDDGRQNDKQAVREAREFYRDADVTLGFVLKRLLSYFAPGFHPWQVDDSEHVIRWYEKNPGPGEEAAVAR